MEAFFQLKAYLETLGERRKMVFIDELPWFDTPRSNFISALELFWNQWASDQNIMLIVCGSATSWMVSSDKKRRDLLLQIPPIYALELNVFIS